MTDAQQAEVRELCRSGSFSAKWLVRHAGIPTSAAAELRSGRYRSTRHLDRVAQAMRTLGERLIRL